MSPWALALSRLMSAIYRPIERDHATNEIPYSFDTDGIPLCRSLPARRVNFSHSSYPDLFISKPAIRLVGMCRLRPAMELCLFTLYGCV